MRHVTRTNRHVAFETARDESAVERLRDVWETLGVTYIDADLDYFLGLVRARPQTERPHVVVVERDGEPESLVVGRIEHERFAIRFGYSTIWRPSLRVLRVAHGGISGAGSPEAAAAVLQALRMALGEREADLVVVPAVRTGSPLARVLSDPAAGRRVSLGEERVHRRLFLPESYDAFLAGRDRKSRYNLKRQATQLEDEFGPRLQVDLLRDPSDFQRVFSDLEHVARETYQRGLGAGFADSPERRELVRIALQRGWFRAWVLTIDGEAAAFWQGNVLNRTYYSSSTAYLPELGRRGVGTYLQMRMFRDLIEDDDVDVVDFGWGDADYKARFGNDSWSEQDVLLFGPSPRGLRTHAAHALVHGGDRLARSVVRATGTTGRVKRAWRSRLARGGHSSP
jgi:CelD/BcsL family acetyltransferase involved in cellulose biosynthesis